MNIWNKALMVAGLCLIAVPAYAEGKRIMIFGDSNSRGWQPIEAMAPNYPLCDRCGLARGMIRH